MAPKRAVEALRFELVIEEEAASEVVDEPSVERAVPPEVTPAAPAHPPTRAERRFQGLQAAREALASGHDPGFSAPERASLDQGMVPGETSDDALGIGAFYDRLRRAVRAGFPDEVWVTGEIRKVTVSKGHRYIELADHASEADESLGPNGRPNAATLEVACWSREWPLIAARLDSVGVELAAGLVVRVRGKVSIWDAGARVRFSMSDLDVEALVGGIAAARRRLLATLAEEGVIDDNRRLPAPLVPLHVGLVTSASSEAYRDFTGQLQRSGYDFKVTLESSLVQGPEAPFQMAQAIERLQSVELDLIVLVRGGGAKGDLAAFDHEAVARAIVSSRYPVWTGIGHTGDRSVADEIAQRALVTPTACGEAVVDGVASFLELLETKARRLVQAAERAMESSHHGLAGRRSDLQRAARHELSSAEASLSRARARAERGATLAILGCATALSRRSSRLSAMGAGELSRAEGELSNKRALLSGFDLHRQLERGWSLTRASTGRIVRSISEIAAGEALVTVVGDGSIHSVVHSTAPGPTEESPS